MIVGEDTLDATARLFGDVNGSGSKKIKKKKIVSSNGLTNYISRVRVICCHQRFSFFFFLLGQLDSHQFSRGLFVSSLRTHQLCNDDARREENALVASRQIPRDRACLRSFKNSFSAEDAPSLSKTKFLEEFTQISSLLEFLQFKLTSSDSLRNFTRQLTIFCQSFVKNLP